MNEVSIATIALAALYLLISLQKFGMTDSISATFYKWKKVQYSAAFVWFCLIVTLGAWLQTIYPLKHDTKLILSLAGTFMFGIGVASTFRDAKVSTMHYVLAVLAILCGFAALSVEHWRTWKCWTPFAAFVVLSVAIRFLWPKWTTYLIEVVALVIIFTML